MIKAGVIVMVALALSACTLGPQRKPAAQMTEAEFIDNFICPEFLSPQGRDNAINNLIDWARVVHPAWTMAQTLDFRRQLLERKNCTATLATGRLNNLNP